MKKWTISGVSNGIESEVRMTADDIVSAFLTENGIYDDNPIIEFIDIALLKRALLSEQAADMPPPAMVAPTQNPSRPASSRKVAPPPKINIGWPDTGKFNPNNNAQVLDVTITWQKNDTEEIRGTIRDEKLIVSTVKENIKEFVRQVAPVYHCTNQLGITTVQNGVMLLDHDSNLRTRAGNIDAFIAKLLSKYPDKQGSDPNEVPITTTMTFSIIYEPSEIVKEHYKEIEHQKKLLEIKRAKQLNPQGGPGGPPTPPGSY
jgi:hypothetical protein